MGNGKRFKPEAIFRPGDEVSIRATVVKGSVPQPDALVLFSIIEAGGAPWAAQAVTDNDGMATATYHLPRQAPSGTYVVNIVDVVNGDASLDRDSSVMSITFTVR
ncbi:MAG: hypothetical protein Kow0047_27910 [Anaerolineae bacterium]